MSRTITLIVVHCSATPSGKRLGGKAPGLPGYRTPVEIIDEWHRARGFARQPSARAAFNSSLQSIGYHFVIDVDGRVFTGRSPDEVGAHVAGHNANSLGVCMVGGAELEGQYTAEQWTALADLVRALRPDPEKRKVCGHRDLSPDADKDGVITSRDWLKTCPGFDVSKWLERRYIPEAKNVVLDPPAAAPRGKS